jgi:septum formation protein
MAHGQRAEEAAVTRLHPAPASIILASASPRRSALLRALGLRYRVVAPRVKETRHGGLPPARLVQANARLKAEAVAAGRAQGVVLGADTIVALRGRLFGKPRDRASAARMLRALSGKTHVVYTGLCLLDVASGRRFAGVAATRVRIRSLSDDEIRRYLRDAAPWDKAGAYAVQHWDRMIVDEVRGSLSNVIGLPLHLVEQGLRRLGVRR